MRPAGCRLITGDVLTVTGKTMAENLADVQPYPAEQDIVRALDNPIKSDSHLRVLYGNLATECDGKNYRQRRHGLHRYREIFDSEEDSLAILNGDIAAGDVVDSLRRPRRRTAT